MMELAEDRPDPAVLEHQPFKGPGAGARRLRRQGRARFLREANEDRAGLNN